MRKNKKQKSKTNQSNYQMWVKIAKFILKFRSLLLLIIGILTLFMLYQASTIEMTYSDPPILPATHPVSQEYEQFRSQFGNDGNLMVIGFQKEAVFEKDFLNNWHELDETIESMEGVDNVLSAPHSFAVTKNKEDKKFDLIPLMPNKISNQAEADSIASSFGSLPFYKNVLYNPETNVYLTAIRIDPAIINSKARVTLVNEIARIAENFGKKNEVALHFSGLPYIHTFKIQKISKELTGFLLLAVLFIAILLFLLFRTFSSVFYPLLVITIGIIWSFGSMALFGYKVTILTGLVPTLISIIGIPNCIYLLNKFQEEFRKHGSRMRAMTRAISRIGHITFFANLTTAIGFGVFALMDSTILKEFGVVASVNIAFTYIISIIVIPAIFTLLPPPEKRHLKHHDRPLFKKILELFVGLTSKHAGKIQLGILGLILLCMGGLFQLKSEGYLVDSITKSSSVYKDLKFFEEHFKGVLPFDILVDTKKKGGIAKGSFMKKIDKVHQLFEDDSNFSHPLSFIDGIKFANQAYFNGKEAFYDLPGSSMERGMVFQYLKNSGNTNSSLLQSLTDSTQQKARISLTMADVGSKRFPELVEELKLRINPILDSTRYDVRYTGSTFVAMEGYNYLVSGLIYSVLLAFLLIACIIAYLFRSPKMLLVALLPNLIPLLVTAAIMGYFNINLNPSTVLVFSVAFGISVDFTIHFLAKYRQELIDYHQSVENAVILSIRETGFSMLYTAVVLLAGFLIFMGSEFKGTFYLGLLTSITLVVALLANLVLLPSIILYFKKYLDKSKAISPNKMEAVPEVLEGMKMKKN